MRVLLTANASYDPPRGGSTRSNLVWLRHLAAQGHEFRLVAGESARPLDLRRAIESWQPDWVLVSSEDLAHGLLREAFRAAPGRVVYLAHTPQFFPFGPQSWNVDAPATELLRGCAAVVAISQTVGSYVREYLGVEPHVIHPPIYGEAPWAASRGDAVLMINPCAVKGIDIFLGLADRFPAMPFRALRGWGTTAEDEDALRARANVTVVESVPDIEEELVRAGVLLAPSLWYEGFGLIVMEAMLRGVRVIASNAGGLVEASLGVAEVIPVRPIADFDGTFDERHMPRAIVPEQNVEPWVHALASAKDTTAARAAAMKFVGSLDAGEFERVLLALRPAPVKASLEISAEKRALLLKKLRAR